MITDPKELKKTSLILTEIFNIAFELRGQTVSKMWKRTENSGVVETTDYFKDEVIRDLELDFSSNDNAHQYHMKILEGYNWDVSRFFKAAANPQIRLSKGIDELDFYDSKGWDKDEELINANNEYFRPKTKIEEDAQIAMKKLETFTQSL